MQLLAHGEWLVSWAIWPTHALMLARRGSGLMQYIELFPLQRILQSNQIAERAIRHEIKWRHSKKLNLDTMRLAFPVFVEVLVHVSMMCSLSVVKWLVES